ncbi:MAG: TIGR04255 family protein, partial [Thermoplasmatota archaeon]
MPTPYGPLQRPPIIEALLDVKVVPAETLELSALEALHGAVAERYPSKRIHKSAQASVRFGPDGQIEVDQTPPSAQGFVFSSADGLALFQPRIDGMTFNRLKPYPGWEAFVAEAKLLWTAYSDAAHPTRVTRIGLRYVNRLDLPLPIADLGQHLHTLPKIADELDVDFEDMLMRLVLRDPGTGLVAILTQAIDRGVGDPGKLPLVLDIDVVMPEPLEVGSDQLWTKVEAMHAFTKRIFFESLTGETRGLYQ